MKTNYVLVGFMGSGKTTIGRALAASLGSKNVDTDDLIVQEAGKPVTEIFHDEGEQGFRARETAVLKKLVDSGEEGVVFSTGGGIVMQKENRELLHRLGTVIFLDVGEREVIRRLGGDTARPLLQGANRELKIRTMMAKRAAAYEESGDIRIRVDGKTPEEIVTEILRDAGAYSSLKDEAEDTARTSGQQKGGVSQAVSPEKEYDMKSDSRTQKDNQAMTEENQQIPKILVINGPNLNFLGIREKSIYGTQDYHYLVNRIEEHAGELGVSAECWQSNHEGAIIDRLQEAYYDRNLIGVVINPGAYTHYSYAIHDALKSVFVPKVEIHISDINAREEFRKVSVTAPACDKQIVGHGLDGYLEAMDYIVSQQSRN